MDAAERWLSKNDPNYKADRAKNLRKKRDKNNYYKSIGQTPPRNPHKRFPLK